MGSKDEKLLGLFLAAILTFTPGCALNNANHTHVDANNDGYCDIDGESMSSSSRSSGTRYFGSHSGSTSSSSSSGHISSGSSPKGGIGSHSSGSGG